MRIPYLDGGVNPDSTDTFGFQFGQVLGADAFNIRCDRVEHPGKFPLFRGIWRLLVLSLREGMVRITSLQLVFNLDRYFLQY